MVPVPASVPENVSASISSFFRFLEKGFQCFFFPVLVQFLGHCDIVEQPLMIAA